MVITCDLHFNYYKMVKAASYAKNPDNLFICTSDDAIMPTENKEIVITGKCVYICVWGVCGMGRGLR